jgi:hypothetical protein
MVCGAGGRNDTWTEGASRWPARLAGSGFSWPTNVSEGTERDLGVGGGRFHSAMSYAGYEDSKRGGV